MLNLELVTYVYESEVCMRGNMLRGTGERMNGQFYSLFHRTDAWPKFLVFVIVAFYVTVFALFVVAYVYIFSGLLGKGVEGIPMRTISSKLDVFKSTSMLPQNLTSSLDTSVLQTVSSDAATNPALHTNVQINGNNVPVPSNGSVHKEISTGNGNASFDVSIQSSGSSNANSSSSLDLNVSSSSNTVSEIQQ